MSLNSAIGANSVVLKTKVAKARSTTGIQSRRVTVARNVFIGTKTPCPDAVRQSPSTPATDSPRAILLPNRQQEKTTIPSGQPEKRHGQHDEGMKYKAPGAQGKASTASQGPFAWPEALISLPNLYAHTEKAKIGAAQAATKSSSLNSPLGIVPKTVPTPSSLWSQRQILAPIFQKIYFITIY